MPAHPALPFGAGCVLSGAAARPALAPPPRARAEAEGPFFEPHALPRSGYDLRLRAAYYTARRDVFDAPVFLFAQPLRRLSADALHIELDLRIAITSHLAFQALMPVSARFVHATFDGLLVSQRQQLAPAELSLSNVGLADPTLLVAYRVLRSAALDGYLEGGSRVALSDNPGGLTLPRQVPLGTGQSALLLGAGAGLRAGRLSASLAYRFEYYPGNAATYLIRRVGPQGYTSGSLDARVGHSVHAEAAYAVSSALSARITPVWSAIELPELVTPQGSVRWLEGSFLQELAVAVEVRFQYDARHAIALAYREPLLASWNDDPFFPIAMPARGVGVTWHASGF